MMWAAAAMAALAAPGLPGVSTLEADYTVTDALALPATYIVKCNAAAYSNVSDGNVGIDGTNLVIYQNGTTSDPTYNLPQNVGQGGNPNRSYVGYKLYSAYPGAKIMDMATDNAGGKTYLDCGDGLDKDGNVYGSLWIPLAEKDSNGNWWPLSQHTENWTITWKDASGNVLGLSSLHESGIAAMAAQPVANIAQRTAGVNTEITSGGLHINGAPVQVFDDGSTNVSTLNFDLQHPNENWGGNPNLGYVGYTITTPFAGATKCDVSDGSNSYEDCQDAPGLFQLWVPVAVQDGSGAWAPSDVPVKNWVITWKNDAGTAVGKSYLHQTGDTMTDAAASLALAWQGTAGGTMTRGVTSTLTFNTVVNSASLDSAHLNYYLGWTKNGEALASGDITVMVGGVEVAVATDGHYDLSAAVAAGSQTVMVTFNQAGNYHVSVGVEY
jgi:hypothetical protein